MSDDAFFQWVPHGTEPPSGAIAVGGLRTHHDHHATLYELPAPPPNPTPQTGE